MLIGLRSALICDTADTDDNNKLTISGVHGHRIGFGHRPAVEKLNLFLDVETDESACVFEVTISSEGWKMTVPTALPDGWRLISLTFPFYVPVIEPGPLVVSVHDVANPSKVWRFDWRLDFEPGAKVLPDQAGARADAHKIARDWAQGMEAAGRQRSGL